MRGWKDWACTYESWGIGRSAGRNRLYKRIPYGGKKHWRDKFHSNSLQRETGKCDVRALFWNRKKKQGMKSKNGIPRKQSWRTGRLSLLLLWHNFWTMLWGTSFKRIVPHKKSIHPSIRPSLPPPLPSSICLTIHPYNHPPPPSPPPYVPPALPPHVPPSLPPSVPLTIQPASIHPPYIHSSIHPLPPYVPPSLHPSTPSIQSFGASFHHSSPPLKQSPRCPLPV